MTGSNYNICARCVMDTSISDIHFDAFGVCNYCRAAEQRSARELYTGPGHEAKLDSLVAKVKHAGRKRPYDCIIGVSGGVDSSYVAYLVKHNFGLRPLAVHFDNGWDSELAVQNIEQLLKTLDIDLVTHVVDWDEFKDLQLAFLRASVANCEIPTDHAILALLYRTAAKHGVKYVLHGGNLATESIMPPGWMHDAKDLRFLNAIHRKFGSGSRRTMPTMGYGRLAWYTLIRGIRYISPLNYMIYDKSAAMQLLETKANWRKYEGKHFESVYTRWFQGYLLPNKFGIDKRRPHFSSLIISGQMSRDGAIRELGGPPYNPDQAQEDVIYIRQKFRLSEADFEQIMRAPVMSSDDYPNAEWLIKKCAPIVSGIKRIATGRDR